MHYHVVLEYLTKKGVHKRVYKFDIPDKNIIFNDILSPLVNKKKESFEKGWVEIVDGIDKKVVVKWNQIKKIQILSIKFSKLEIKETVKENIPPHYWRNKNEYTKEIAIIANDAIVEYTTRIISKFKKSREYKSLTKKERKNLENLQRQYLSSNYDRRTQEKLYDDIVFNKFIGLNEKQKNEKRERALNLAYKNRNFEIDLYWKRSIYFWGFQTVMLVALSTIFANWRDILKAFNSFSNSVVIPQILSFLIAAMGLFISIAWFSLTKSSKAYAENWERHIDFLEYHFVGNLYRTVVGDKKNFYSLSNINKSVAFGWGTFWFIAFASIYVWIGIEIFNKYRIEGYIIFGVITFITLLLICIFGYLPRKWLTRWSRNSDYERQISEGDATLITLRRKEFENPHSK